MSHSHSHALPPFYRVARFEELNGDLKIVSVPFTQPGPGQIVLKTLACGVCHSDSFVQKQTFPVGFPRVPGHEIVGTVVAVGEGVTEWQIDSRVGSGWHGGHCGVCRNCRAGDFNTCVQQNINGIITDGGYGEYVTLRSEACLSVPEDLDPAEAAPLLCAGLTTFNAMRNVDIRAGDTVAVQGVGGLGHLAIQFARAMGMRVVALSRGTDKQALAEKLGAHVYIDSDQGDSAAQLQALGGAKAIVCNAPSGKAISSLISGLSVSGQLVVLALADDLTVPLGDVISKRLALRGWPSGTALDAEETIAFAKLSGVKCQIERFTLDQANEAYKSMLEGKARFRAVLTFEA